MTEFIFVTQSSNKLKEAERILGFQISSYHLDLPEVQAIELEEVANYKVQFAYNALGKKPVMIEDTGLFIEAWNGLPGALVKWFIGSVEVAGICKMMNQFSNRKAIAKTVIAIHDGQTQYFVGEVEGRIAFEPKGTEGFGWDKIFIPGKSRKTFAQLQPTEKDKYSMRRIALEAMKRHFHELQ